MDHGCYNGEMVDFPDIARRVCESITRGEAQRGIMLCGSGAGAEIACNKMPGIRAACDLIYRYLDSEFSGDEDFRRRIRKLEEMDAEREGQQVYHAGCVGKDGRFLLDTLREAGVNTEYVHTDGSIIGHALIQVDDAGENCIILYPGSNYENDTESMDEVFSHFESSDILLLQNEIKGPEILLKKGQEE